jgi:hypothetical protein
MVNCVTHGEQADFVIGTHTYCSKCVVDKLAKIKLYPHQGGGE